MKKTWAQKLFVAVALALAMSLMPAVRAIDQDAVDQAWAALISAYDAYPGQLENEDISDADFITYSTQYFSGLASSLDNLEIVLGEVLADPTYTQRESVAELLGSVQQLNVYYQSAIGALAISDFSGFYDYLDQATALEDQLFAATDTEIQGEPMSAGEKVTIAYAVAAIAFFMGALVAWRWAQKAAATKQLESVAPKRMRVFRDSLWPLAGALIALLIHLAAPESSALSWVLIGPVVFGVVTAYGSYSVYRHENIK